MTGFERRSSLDRRRDVEGVLSILLNNYLLDEVLNEVSLSNSKSRSGCPAEKSVRSIIAKHSIEPTVEKRKVLVILEV